MFPEHTNSCLSNTKFLCWNCDICHIGCALKTRNWEQIGQCMVQLRVVFQFDNNLTLFCEKNLSFFNILILKLIKKGVFFANIWKIADQQSQIKEEKDFFQLVSSWCPVWNSRFFSIFFILLSSVFSTPYYYSTPIISLYGSFHSVLLFCSILLLVFPGLSALYYYYAPYVYLELQSRYCIAPVCLQPMPK